MLGGELIQLNIASTDRKRIVEPFRKMGKAAQKANLLVWVVLF